MDRKQIVDDWLAQRLETLHPGWRGRLLVTAPEEAEDDAREQLVGTVEGEPQIERDPESGEALDAVITFCTNWRDGRFVPLADDETRVTVCASQIEDMQPL